MINFREIDRMDLRFQYLKQTKENTSIQGLFVFSLYIKPKHLENNQGSFIFVRPATASPYVQGIQLYIDCINQKSSVFEGWKVLLYTDTPTLKILESDTDFLKNPFVDICLVEWPYYTPIEGEYINGDILRCMRFRSFFDFTTIPVFVRDADTIFITDIKKNECYKKLLKDECKNIVYEWEKNFYLGAKEYPNTWFFGTSLFYKAPWHKNSKRGYIAPVGALAGFQSLIPSVPCFQSEDLWNKAVAYIQEQSQRIQDKEQIVEKQGIEYILNGKISYSNDETYEKIGKDERILIYIFLPYCDMRNIFFFELDLVTKRPFSLKGKKIRNLNYPSYILSRGSNANIQNLFTQALTNKNRPFHINLNETRKSLVKRNKNLWQTKYNALQNNLRTLKNKNNEFDETFDIRTAVNDIYDALKMFDTNEELKYFYSQYMNYKEISNAKKKNFLNTMSFSNSKEEIATEMAKLDDSIYAKDKALLHFIEKSLSMKSKEEILESFSMFKKPRIKAFLESFTNSSKKGGTRKSKRN